MASKDVSGRSDVMIQKPRVASVNKVKGYNLNAQTRTVFPNKYTNKRIVSSINLGKAVSDTACLKFVKVLYPLEAIADFLNHTIINHWLNYTVEKAVSDGVILPTTPETS